MREIKLRARRSDDGRWVYGDYFRTPLTDENSGTNPDAGWFFLTGAPRHCIAQNGVAFVVDKNTLGEFTGLLDKNGKEIYEGDIVKDRKGRTLEVFWNDLSNGFWYLIKNIEGEKYHVDSRSMGERGNPLEVIGNIHESPELLKEPK